MHTVLEHLDFSGCGTLQAVCDQIISMQTGGFLTKEEADAVPAEQIFAFMQSELGKRILSAKSVKREVSFGIPADAEAIFGIPGQVMLQGMIDCVLFEEDGISIIDYKTDRIGTPEEISDRYKIQLACYKQAAETMYGKKVLHSYLYLFSQGKWIEL